jgi:hypothetical protein
MVTIIACLVTTETIYSGNSTRFNYSQEKYYEVNRGMKKPIVTFRKKACEEKMDRDISHILIEDKVKHPYLIIGEKTFDAMKKRKNLLLRRCLWRN